MLGRTLRWQRVRTVCAAPAPSARCFCDAPAAPVASAADWVDPRGSYVAQRQAYKAEVSNLRKQYAAEVAAKREAKLKAHDAALQRIKESNTKSNVEAKALKMAQNAERLREFQRQHAEYVALKRARGEAKYAEAERVRKLQVRQYIEGMSKMGESWIKPDEVEERIIYALENPIRSDGLSG